MVPLHMIAELAPRVGLPSHKPTLIRALDAAGAHSQMVRVRGGQLGKVYDPETLPVAVRAALNGNARSAETAGTVPFSRYENAPQSLKDEAHNRLRLVEKVRALLPSTSASAAIARVALDGDISGGTLKRYWYAVRDLPWSDWLSALVPDYKGRQPEPTPEPAWEFFKGFYGRQSEPSLAYAYQETVKAARHHGWGELPSDKTFRRRWNALPIATRTLWRKGKKAAEKLIPTAELDRDGVRALDIVSIDGRLFDLFVQGTDGAKHRLWVAAAVDVGTNYCLAYVVGQEGEVENGDLYRRLILACCDIGLPNICFQFDNTMAAANKKITGGADIRFRFNRREDELKGILARIAVGIRFSLPGNAQSKMAERFWRDVLELAEKHPLCEGAYTGRSPTHKPGNYGESAIPRETFIKVLAEAVAEYNERTGRRSKVAKGRSYRQTFETKLQGVQVRKLTADQRRWFSAEAHHITPSPAGTVRLGKAPFQNTYWHEALRDYAGTKIVVLADPEDYTTPLMALCADDGRLIVREVPIEEQRGANNADSARAVAKAKGDLKKLDRARAKAERRLDAAETASLMAPREPTPAAPGPAVVQIVPGSRPAVVNGKSAKTPVPKSAPAAPAPEVYAFDAELAARTVALMPSFDPQQPTPERQAKAAELGRIMEFLRTG